MSTTWALIRAAMETAIEALTPASVSTVRYVAADDSAGFETWAEASTDACLRRYTIVRGSDSGEGLTNTDLELRRVGAEVVLAYPMANLATYGLDNRRSLDDLIDEDGRQIDDAIGVRGGGSYAASVHLQAVTARDVERGDAVAFLRLPMTIVYEEAG